MARQLITITKIIQGIDEELDSALDSVNNALDLSKFVGTQHSGKGMLYWACFYDPWLTGDRFDLNRFGIDSKGFYGDLFNIDLRSPGWQSLPRDSNIGAGEDEERWLLQHLHEAYNTFSFENSRANLIMGRYILGGSLDDSELLGQ